MRILIALLCIPGIGFAQSVDSLLTYQLPQIDYVTPAPKEYFTRSVPKAETKQPTLDFPIPPILKPRVLLGDETFGLSIKPLSRSAFFGLKQDF